MPRMSPLMFRCTSITTAIAAYPHVTLTRGCFVDKDGDELAFAFGDDQPSGSEWVELDGTIMFHSTEDDFEVGRIYIYSVESHFSLAEDQED